MTGSTDIAKVIDLSLVVECEADEDCFQCGKQATGYVEYADVCCAFPNPAPLCEGHYRLVQTYLRKYGPFDWACPMCNAGTDVVDLRRTR